MNTMEETRMTRKETEVAFLQLKRAREAYETPRDWRLAARLRLKQLAGSHARGTCSDGKLQAAWKDYRTTSLALVPVQRAYFSLFHALEDTLAPEVQEKVKSPEAD